MDIFCISGSASPQSSNYYLLKAIQREFNNQYTIEVFDEIRDFELFTPQRLEQGEPSDILEFCISVFIPKRLLLQLQ
ncbi:MAG: hypothetical protein RI558_07315 [Psychroflexus sp.]|nr:hypothetical protein [Psychroflexus sp.]